MNVPWLQSGICYVLFISPASAGFVTHQSGCISPCLSIIDTHLLGLMDVITYILYSETKDLLRYLYFIILWSKLNHEMMRSLWHLWSSKDGFTESVENKSGGVLSVRANISTLKYQHTDRTRHHRMHAPSQTNWQIHKTWVHIHIQYTYHLYSFADSTIIFWFCTVWVII